MNADETRTSTQPDSQRFEADHDRELGELDAGDLGVVLDRGQPGEAEEMDSTCTTPNSHSARLMPIFTIHRPPSMPPITAGHSPAFFAIRPICVLLKPMSQIERRGQRGAHAVAELVEQQERPGSAARYASRCRVMNSVERLDHRFAQGLGRAERGAAPAPASVIAMPGSA